MFGDFRPLTIPSRPVVDCPLSALSLLISIHKLALARWLSSISHGIWVFSTYCGGQLPGLCPLYPRSALLIG